MLLFICVSFVFMQFAAPMWPKNAAVMWIHCPLTLPLIVMYYEHLIHLTHRSFMHPCREAGSHSAQEGVC